MNIRLQNHRLNPIHFLAKKNTSGSIGLVDVG
jgi:hypothetical protein